MSTLIIALILLGFIGLVVGILLLVHRRDQKREAAKNLNTP